MNDRESKIRGIIHARSLVKYFLVLSNRDTKNRVTEVRYNAKLIPRAKTSFDQKPQRKIIKKSDKRRLVLISVFVASGLFSISHMLELKDRIFYSYSLALYYTQFRTLNWAKIKQELDFILLLPIFEKLL